MEENQTDGFFEAEADAVGLVARYEHMLQGGAASYFEEEDFELIIDYYMQEQSFEKGLEASNKGLSLYPFSQELSLQRTELLLLDNRAEEALALLDSIDAMSPKNLDVLLLKARAFLQLRQFSHARALFESAYLMAESAEEQIDMLCLMANEMIVEGEYHTAISYLLRAERLDAQDLEVLNDLAYCYERIGQLPQSIVYYERYLEKDPFNERVWYNLGTLHGQSDGFDKAVEALDYALALNPGNSSATYNKATVCLHAQQYDRAIELYHEFLKMEPGNVDALYGLADIYMFRQQWEVSRQYIEQAFASGPPRIAYWMLLACQQEEAGCIEEAIVSLNRALELSPDNEEYLLKMNELKGKL